MKKIVHIASDEKFINSAYVQFNSLGKEVHYFYILVNNTKEKLRYVNKEKHMQLVTNEVRSLKKLAESLHVNELVCFHGLNYETSIILNRLRNNQKVLWILFGQEFYNNPRFFHKEQLTGQWTYNKFIKQSILNKINLQFKDCFRGLNYFIKKGTKSPFSEVTKAMKRANYCAILYEEEFQFIKDRVKIDINYVKFTYYPIELMVDDLDVSVSGSNILLGNSASYTNNHIEAFKILKLFDLKGIDVVTPLSYGNKDYGKEIIKIGNKELGESFISLVDFMPLHEYNKYLRTCSIVVMNHYRQQAVGNVLTMLWMGAKVYLDDRNTLYHYLKRIGIHVYEIKSDLNRDNKEALQPLSNKQKLHNRNCLAKEISQETTLVELKKAIQNIICQ